MAVLLLVVVSLVVVRGIPNDAKESSNTGVPVQGLTLARHVLYYCAIFLRFTVIVISFYLMGRR